MNSTRKKIKQKTSYKSKKPYLDRFIDEKSDEDANTYYFFDDFNNYTFSVTRQRGSTFISPVSAAASNLTEIKVGVLLPFHQNNDKWTKIMTMSGVSAIRLAVAEINTQQMIPGAYVTLVEKDSYPKDVEGQAAITQAVYSAISLIQEGVVGVIGDISSSWTSFSALMTSTLQIPQCSFSAVATSLSDKSQFGYFFRTVPTSLLYSDAAVSFIVSQGWPVMGVLYSDDDFGQQLSESVVMKARTNSISVKSYQSFYESGPKSDIKKSLDALMSTGVRVVFVAAEDEALLAAFTIAAQSGYINNDTVWITTNMDTNRLFKSVYNFNSILERRSNHTNSILVNYTVSDDPYRFKKQSIADPVDPVAYAAKTTSNLTTISYNQTFSGGIFVFESLHQLYGYEPYDIFHKKWAGLDPRIYPYGGQSNMSSNEGMAYSCMMVMADGFKQIIYNSTLNETSTSDILKNLASGQLGDYLGPSAFNTSFLGPIGPVVFDQNGDLARGNFKILNIQDGIQVDIGRTIAGDMNLTSLPIYHDGTTKAPTGVPNRSYLNPGYKSPVSLTLLSISGFGTIIALFSIFIVVKHRKNDVFRVSSPLFCVLELIGFLLTYISVVLFLGYRTTAHCTIMPITFHLGYALILGNLVAKNYRIYKIFNNIFITKTTVTDKQLLKVSGAIFAVTASILIAWFSSTSVSTVNKPVSRNAYYTDCAYDGSNVLVFFVLLMVSAALQLLSATFLAFKTRSVGKNYSKYSEYKQIGLSVYNIFFSVIIGFLVFFVPTADFYTRHYLTATMIVWATTFSLLALFVPKLHAFFSPSKAKRSNSHGKASDLSRRKRYAKSVFDVNSENKSDCDEDEANVDDPAFCPPQFNSMTRSCSQFSGLKSLNYMVNNISQYETWNSSKIKLNNLNNVDGTDSKSMEVHEAEVPLQYTFKFFPFLSAWKMAQIVLIPDIYYFSFYSKKNSRGVVFRYCGATIVSSKKGSYILKVYNHSFWSVLIQVETEKNLIQWHEWFNNGHANSSANNDFSIIDESTCLGSPSSSNEKRFNNGIFNKCEDQDVTLCHNTSFTRQLRLDSGITTEHLLAPETHSGFGSISSGNSICDGEERRGSEMTLADSVENSYYYEADPDLSRHYGVDEINRAKKIQEKRQQEMMIHNAELYTDELALSHQSEANNLNPSLKAMKRPDVAQSIRNNEKSSFLDMFSTNKK